MLNLHESMGPRPLDQQSDLLPILLQGHALSEAPDIETFPMSTATGVFMEK